MAESFTNKIVRAAGIVSTTDAGASIGAGASAITSIQTADLNVGDLVVNQHFRAGAKIHSITNATSLLVDRSSTNTAAATGQIVKFLGVTTAYTSPAATKSILIGGTFANLTQNDINVYVEEDCGIKSGFSNDDYSTVGVEILKTQESLIDKSDILLSINPLDIDFSSISKKATSKIFIGNFNFNNLVPDKRFTFLALEKIPRIARAQSMDILSSQASIAGYQASLLAANHLNKYFPMLITAAGTISPAKILVVGAGVAGLQAIATCNRLGAKVTGFDVRESTKEQVESVGGKFLQLDYEYNDSDEQGYAKEQSDEIQKKQNEMLSKYIENSDCVITTAAIPGKQAPKIVTNENVQNMNPGSVIIDLAGETGGNCELGKYGDIEIHNGVIIDKPKNITNLVAEHSSLVFSRNVESFLNLIIKEDKVNLDLNDEIIKSTNLNLGASNE